MATFSTIGFPMEGVCSVHARQIMSMSDQIFKHSAQIDLLNKQVTVLHSQMQSALHVSTVDARLLSFVSAVSVMRQLATKINELVTHARRPTKDEEAILLSDLEMINMELGLSDLDEDKQLIFSRGRDSDDPARCR